MSDQVGREKEASDERLTGRDEVLLLGWAVAALAAVLGALSFFSRSLPADSRWCAVLASACLNVLAVTLWSPLSARRSAGGAEGPGWKRALMFLWQIIRQDPDAEDLKLEGRPIRWQPWAVIICTGLSVAIAVKALKPFPPAALLHAMVSPSLVIACGATALVLAFLTLVVERFYTHDAQHAPASRSASLAGMLRVVLLCALAAAVSAAWFVYMHTTLDLLVHAVAIFTAAIAVELMLRVIIRWFLPPRRLECGAGSIERARRDAGCRPLTFVDAGRRTARAVRNRSAAELGPTQLRAAVARHRRNDAGLCLASDVRRRARLGSARGL
ncbi:hypothetical protein PQR34_20965 [Paraburkholderia sediminicola]|uniref:hypothetical protein n=1 Tax=Paraburkholderia sediminicola TaxID=458836 RepID=UPI0038BDE529